MLGEEAELSSCQASGTAWKTYARSVSWTDRSPSRPDQKLKPNCKPPRLGLPPLSIARRPVEEWPRASCDDLGVWPSNNNPQTPRDFQLRKDKLAFFDKECSRIADHVYLGSDAVAKNREVLTQNGITHVLNCVGFVCPEYFKSDLVYKTLWLQDSPTEDITSVLYDVFDYFEHVREKGGRVLVHCYQGVSRSASLVIAYLMWRQGQSFEDAFQYVKAARGITNPNMGFTCQLLQCQKRVHALPPSPSSLLRMYRMAPHSSYDPLHLVAKVVDRPSAQGLDSRGAFVVHVPAAIYVWFGKHCELLMLNQAKKAANQVVRYERAQCPVMIVNEGEEPIEFWKALVNRLLLENEQGLSLDKEEDGEKRVSEYDLDFEIFQQALAGGVVPPVSVSGSELETCLPARENGWGEPREEFANSPGNDFDISSHMIIDPRGESGNTSPIDFSPSSTESAYAFGSPGTFGSFPSSLERIKDASNVSLVDPLSPPMPSLSPSTSDYASSFTFSPSSSSWSDFSCLSSCQPSPSSLGGTDLIPGNNVSLVDNPCSLYGKPAVSPAKALSSNRVSRLEKSFSGRDHSPSIAERRGNNPPPRMILPSVNEGFQGGSLVRTLSFSLPDLDCDHDQIEQEGGGYELEFDANMLST